MSLIAQKLISASGGVQEETDDSFNLVTSLYSFDGSNGAQNNTLLDSSPESHTVTRNADIVQGSFSPFSAEEGKWSIFFDGTDDYIDVGSSNATQLGSGNFTVEFWIKTSDTSFNIANPDSETGSGYWGLMVQYGDLRWNDSYAVSNKWVVDGAGILDDAWHHVAIVRNSGTIAVYFDGTAQSLQSGSFSDSTDYSGSDGLRIGSGNLDEFAGYLSNFRSVSGTAVYTSNYSAPSTPLTAITNTKVLVCCSNRFRDKSTSAHRVAPNASGVNHMTSTILPKVQPFSPFAPSAAYDPAVNGGSGFFDQTSDCYFDVSDATDFDFGTGDYTVEMWVYPTTTFIVNWAMAFNTIGVNQYWAWTDGGGNSAAAGLSSYPSGNYSGSFDHMPNRFSWSHIVFQNTSGTENWYINGVRVYNATNNPSFSASATGVRVGLSPAYASQFFYGGYISDVRVLKGSNAYSNASTLTVPTAPLGSVTNTKLLTNFTNAAIFDQSGKTNVDTVGNAQLDTTVKKFGTASAEFDGTGDYLLIPSSNFIPFGAGDFTVECFLNINSGTSSTGSNDAALMDCRASGATANGFGLGLRPNGTTNFKLNFYTDGASNLDGQTMNYGTWYHVAISRSGSTIRFFVDGTTTTNITKSNNFSDQPDVTIGSSLNYVNSSLIGFIDQFRLTRAARYTSNFTAPTKEFPNL